MAYLLEISDNCICKRCRKCDGKDEIEENIAAIWCNYAQDYLENEPTECPYADLIE